MTAGGAAREKVAAGEHDGTISGTPAYMAPEQLEGRPATIQSDLYALGPVMYELFTGKRAYDTRTVPERLREISSEIATPRWWSATSTRTAARQERFSGCAKSRSLFSTTTVSRQPIPPTLPSSRAAR